MRKSSIAARLSAAACLVLGLTITGAGQSISSNLSLSGAPLSVSRGNITKKQITNVPSGMAGSFRIKLKWHAKTFIPNTFNKLRIELMHGTSVKKTSDCYSIHSDKLGKCDFTYTVSESLAAVNETWYLRITNNSEHDTDGLNIRKESTELNPFVPNFTSTFTPDCSVRFVSYSGASTVDPFSIVEGRLNWSTTLSGRLRIRAKWHSDSLIPNFKSLKVEVLTYGNVRATDTGYSIHSSESNKLDLSVDLPGINTGLVATPVNLRITNSTNMKITGFGIRNGSDFLVPQFQSTFTPGCN